MKRKRKTDQKSKSVPKARNPEKPKGPGAKKPIRLTDKQERFVSEYLVDLNATAAALRAGYAKGSAKQTGSENLSKPDIATRIQELQGKISERNDLEIDAVIGKIHGLAFSNIDDFLDVLNMRNDFAGVTRDQLASVQSIKKTFTSGVYQNGGTWEKTVFEFKLYNKLEALDKLVRHLGGYAKDKGFQVDANFIGDKIQGVQFIIKHERDKK